jgi:hypothetical protein
MGTRFLIERATGTVVDQCVVGSGNFLLNVSACPYDQRTGLKFALFLDSILLFRTIE